MTSIAARAGGFLRRPVTAGITLAVVYVAFLLALDPDAATNPDAGARIATIRTMEQSSSFVPEVGYWAESWDPDGRFHPFLNVSRVGDRWVAVGTLPTLYPGLGLYELGGVRLLMLIPVLGAVATAFGARAIARIGRPGSDGWASFWVVGIASPLLFYAVDFWDHSLGLACLLWALVWLIGTPVRRTWPVLGAGVLLGVAATMRTEALVYAAVIGVVAVVWRCSQDGWRPRRAVVTAGWLAPGVIVPVAANLVLERIAFGDSLRGARTAGYAEEVGEIWSDRFANAMISGFGFDPSADAPSVVLGLVVFAMIGAACALGWKERPDLGALLLLGAGSLVLVTSGAELDFVPGAFAAMPIAVLGLFAIGRAEWRPFGVVAVLGIAGVWATQPLVRSIPTWGGRYLLCSGLLLLVMGVETLPRVGRPLRVALVVWTVAITAAGGAWMIVYTHAGGRLADALTDTGDTVVLTDTGLLLSRVGGVWEGQRWLILRGDATPADLAARLEELGVDRFAYLTALGGEPADGFGGFCLDRETTIPYVSGLDLRMLGYVERKAPGAC